VNEQLFYPFPDEPANTVPVFHVVTCANCQLPFHFGISHVT